MKKNSIDEYEVFEVNPMYSTTVEKYPSDLKKPLLCVWVVLGLPHSMCTHSSQPVCT